MGGSTKNNKNFKWIQKKYNDIDNLSLYYNQYYFIILLLYFRMYPSVMCFFLSGTSYSVVDAGFGDVLKITVIRFKDQP